MKQFIVTTIVANNHNQEYYIAENIDAVYQYLFDSEAILNNLEDICIRFRNIEPEIDDIEGEIEILKNTITIDEIKEFHEYYHTGGYGFQEENPAKEWETILVEEYNPEFINVYDVMKKVENLKLQRKTKYNNILHP